MLPTTTFGLLALGMGTAASAGMVKRGWENSYTATATKSVAKAAATAKTSSPTSHVKGKAFDRIAIFYFENTNFDKAYGDPNFSRFAKMGITLTNYFAVTHPSQPNYMASIAGDYFGMDHDDFSQSPQNISTVIDLLESRGISWGHYQEGMPYSGYEGLIYYNPKTENTDYVRKHNPAIMHNSLANSEQRLSQIKNLSMTDTSRSMFHKDLTANTLPQWMFITPNMTSDGHNSDISTAGRWCRSFLDPLLKDANFIKNTMVLITWDENETYNIRNNILGILIGDAIPEELVGTGDDNFYTHYSELATVEANWDLPSDAGTSAPMCTSGWPISPATASASSNRTKKRISMAGTRRLLGASGRRRKTNYTVNRIFPAPNLKLDENNSKGRPILQSVKDTWAHSDHPTYYVDSIGPVDGLNPPEGYEP